MSHWRHFAATNDPDTCLWCGRRLRLRGHTTYEDTDKKPRRCVARTGIYGAEVCGNTDIDGSRADGWRCEHGHLVDPVRRVVSHGKTRDKSGDYADGFFCGLRCAYLFAVRIATLGRRLQSKTVQP